MNRSRLRSLLVLGLVLAPSLLLSDEPGRDSRLFRLNKDGSAISGPALHLPPLLGLQLLSATTDQPQYWPEESVSLRLLCPAHPKDTLQITWQKRDAAPQKQTVTLDEGGVAAVVLQDGATTPLELGEYRADIVTSDGQWKASATWSVVQGVLSPVSLAYPFVQVTSIAELDQAKAGWFLGNAGGAGSRWGNGLSFKNELRVDNQPYNGEVELASRCMLPGCNGVDAGPRQTLTVRNGLVQGTLQVGGHSGPFQVEFILPNGSLRYQFQGSSHVERDMVAISQGMTWNYRAGLAPYSGTVQVTGRQIFVEKSAQAQKDDAFELLDVTTKTSQVAVHVTKPLHGLHAVVWTPGRDGHFEPQSPKIPNKVSAGAELLLEVQPPLSLVTVGGWDKDGLHEAWAFVYPSVDLHLTVTAPERGEPLEPVTLIVQAQDQQGKPLQVSGIIEVYDNRVAAREPGEPLNSALGETQRTAANGLASWVDPEEIKRQQAAERKRELEEERQQKLQEARMRSQASKKKESVFALGSGGPAYARSAGYWVGSKLFAADEAAAPPPSSPTMARAKLSKRAIGHVDVDDDESGNDQVRLGEKKVLLSAVVRTGPDGKANVLAILPPQTGRVAVRFTATKGLDWAKTEASLDVRRSSYVELQVPKVFVPGADLQLAVFAVNGGQTPLELRASGAGLPNLQVLAVPPGKQHLVLPWQGNLAGVLDIQLAVPGGRVKDHRQYALADVARLPVTWSRLAFASEDRKLSLAPGERVVVFHGPGELLHGVVNNVVTTLESWFPHAEAMSAQVAAQAVLLAAIEHHVLDDEGLTRKLQADMAKAAQGLQQRLYDPASQMMRPFNGLPPQPLWSLWVSRNLHVALRALQGAPRTSQQAANAVLLLTRLTADLDVGMAKRGQDPKKLAGFDPSQAGEDVLPVVIDGQEVDRIITDDAVQAFVLQQLAPDLDPDQATLELACAKSFDHFRFLRAMSRTGRLQYLITAAKAALIAGPKGRAQFDRLYAIIARGLVFSQEPGLLQGPALLGGVYSTPMALVRFLELTTLASARQKSKGNIALQQGDKVSSLAFGQRVVVGDRGATLQLPADAVARIDRAGVVDLREGQPGGATAVLSNNDLKMGQQAELEVTLPAGADPLQYYALIAVPTTTVVKQTEDILSDDKGQLLYGQQGTGSSKMQVVAVPFRGSRSIKLWLEGAFPGRATGLVAIRHLWNSDEVHALPIGAVHVQAPVAPAEVRATQG